MANITKKLNSVNPSNNKILGFWIDGEIVCLQCLTEEEKKQQTMRGDTIFRKDVEDRLNSCDRCARALSRDVSRGPS